MENADSLKLLKLAVNLLELHDENPFKVRAYQNALLALEKLDAPFGQLPLADLEQLAGVGKSIAAKLDEINRTGTFTELEHLLTQTPEGVVDMFDVKGIGPKKIRLLWKELGIENTYELLLACNDNRVAKLKGFGEKTQETIRQGLLFAQAAAAKLRLNHADALANDLLGYLQQRFDPVAISGQVRRRLEVIDQVQLVVATDQPGQATDWLNQRPDLRQNQRASSPFAWRGHLTNQPIQLDILFATPDRFASCLFAHSAAKAHLAHRTATGDTLLKLATAAPLASEADLYQRAGLPYLPPELREGQFEFDWAQQHTEPELITWAGLRGILHNHSTYSDGKHTLEAMARHCRDLGFAYLGISDHSQSAYYANGLTADRVAQQHREIDALNQQLAPFRILKGIESDILADGSLDYPDPILATFDFVVASIHSNFKMDEARATERLVRAIQNPYTTILGHPTGRLLLRREGYPINHRAVIDACAAHGVVIELNANPWRLDLDWRWIPYALERGVRISINPDAHERDGYLDMHYGVSLARKGGLLTAMTFNALPLAEMEAFLENRKVGTGGTFNA